MGCCAGYCHINYKLRHGVLYPSGTVPYGTTLHAVCDTGYIPTPPVVCSPRSTPPACISRDCSPPEGPYTTHLTADALIYVGSCNSTTSCFYDGGIEAEVGVCRTCRAPRIRSGYILPHSGTHFMAHCDNGFLPDKDVFTCDEEPATCRITCPEHVIEHGNVSITTTRRSVAALPLAGDVVDLVSCKLGYQITGTDQVTCLPSGSYDKQLGSCQPVRCPNLFVVDGAVIPDIRPRAGEKVFVNCEIGWILIGPSEARCLNNGSYDVYELGPCVKATFNRCPLRQPLNGYTIPLLPSVAEGTFVQIFCNRTHRLVGNNYVRCSDIGVFDYPLGTCSGPNNPASNETFSPSGPSRHPSPHNKTHCEEYVGDFKREGEVKPSGRIGVGEEIALACPDGYTIVGNQTAECRPNGTYSHILGVCANLTCPDIEIKRGQITPPGRVLEDVIIRLSCEPDHVIIGEREVRCLKGGFYNRTIGTCKRVCQPPEIEHAEIQIYQPHKVGIRIPYELRKIIYEGGHVTVYCQRGYKLVGPQRLKCTKYGTYKGALPRCVDVVKCSVPRIHNGYTGATGTISQGETVYMACNYGLPNGHQSATCLPSGELDRVLGACSQYGYCHVEDRSNMVSSSRVAPGTEYLLTCEVGYLPVGNSAARCMGDGFNVTIGDCIFTNTTCPIERPSHGVTSIEGNVNHGDNVLLSCDEGYIIHGSTIARCRSNGILDTELGRCIKDKSTQLCVAPRIAGGYSSVAPGHWGNILIYTRIEIKCYHGYSLHGNMHITCLGSNEYDKQPGSCTKAWCIFTIPHGGTYNVTMATTRVITCNVGYHVTGNGMLYCGAVPGTCVKNEEEEEEEEEPLQNNNNTTDSYPDVLQTTCTQQAPVHKGEVMGRPLSRRDKARLSMTSRYDRCSLSGGLHVRTFSGTRYRFQSRCSYVLATDCKDYTYFIVAHTGPCSPTTTSHCLLSITLMKGADSVTLIRGWGVQVGEKTYHLSPQRKKVFGSTAVYRTEKYVYLRNSFLDVVLRYDGLSQVELLSRDFTTTCGLCNPPGIPDVPTFIQSYQTEYEQCDLILVNDKCSSDPLFKQKADSLCSIVLGHAFSRCHKVVSPTTMFTQCVEEVCQMDWRRRDYVPLCSALGEIANTCRQRGRGLGEWRCNTPCDWETQYNMVEIS